MSLKTEDIVIENSTNHPEKDDGDEEENIDESVLIRYMTDDSQIAPDIIEGLRSDDRNARLEAVTKLRQLASSRKSMAIQPILDSDLLSTITEMMCSEDVELQTQAIRIMPILTSGTPEQVSAVVEAGVLPRLIGLASSAKSDAIRDCAFLGLGNIGLGNRLGKKLVEAGGLKPMLDVLANPSMYAKSNLYHAADALSSYALANGRNVPEHEMTRMITVLSKYILYQQDERTKSLQESLHSLQHILMNAVSVNKACRETNLIPRLVHLSTSQEIGTRRNAYFCVDQIVMYSADGVEGLINAGILDVLKTRLAIGNGLERSQTCFTASNLVVDRLGHAKALIEAGFVPTLVKMLLDQEEHAGARSNAAWTLGNLATDWGETHHEILDTLLEADALEALCSSLTLRNRSGVEPSLKALLVFLGTHWEGRERAVERVKAVDGIERLRRVRFRNDIYRTDLHKVAQTILTNHFPEFSLPARI